MHSQSTWAIVPVKALKEAKGRLSAVLAPESRRRLVLTMLDDVLATLRQVRFIDAVLVVTPDAQVAAFVEARGARVLHEERATGLNPAVANGLAHAQGQGAGRALVLPADVPLAAPEEVRGVIAAIAAPARDRVALVSSADGEGTNALALAPPDVLAPSFGPGSFVRHLARAVAQRLDTRVLQMPGIAADIDEPRDIADLLARPEASARYGFLQPRQAWSRTKSQTGAREQ
jgi:2-phospho-L-lactate guanylyltransferase